VFSRVMPFVTGFILLPENRVRALLYCPCSLPEASVNLFFLTYAKSLCRSNCAFLSFAHRVYVASTQSILLPLLPSALLVQTDLLLQLQLAQLHSFFSATLYRSSRPRASLLPTNTKLPSICLPFVFVLSCFNQGNPPDFYVIFLPFSQLGNFAQESRTATS
jgi:hypothetical protein